MEKTERVKRKKNGELNKREKTILKFIEKSVQENGYAPSVREIGKAVGLKSTATVHGYLARLSEEGFIKKENNKGRTLKLLKNSAGEMVERNGKCTTCWKNYSWSSNFGSRKCNRYISNTIRFCW